jgi:hypothetical protein
MPQQIRTTYVQFYYIAKIPTLTSFLNPVTNISQLINIWTVFFSSSFYKICHWPLTIYTVHMMSLFVVVEKIPNYTKNI